MSAIKRSSLSICVLIYKIEGIMIVIRTLESDKLCFNSGFITVFFFFFFKYSYLFILVLLGLHCCAGFSLFSESGGYSLLALLGLFIAMASLVVQHGL